MNSDIDLILLVVMITCAAFVGAINSKGTAKMTVSYILAFVCLAISAFKIAQYSMDTSKRRNVEIAQEVGRQIVEENLEIMEERNAAEKSKATQEEMDNYKRTAASILSDVGQVNQKLAGFRLEAETDDQYENLKGRASFYLGEMKRHKGKVKGIQVPQGLESVHEAVTRAVDVQLYACSKLRRYYNAENAEEERETARIFRSKNSQAASLISKAEMGLR